MLNTFEKMKQNCSIQECLNTIPTAEFNQTIWFIYYMFFAIHNPKMEEYIQKKLNTTPTPTPTPSAAGEDQHQYQQAHRDIIKNMIKRRHHTSEIVFQLYTHAYTNQGNVTHIYPKYKDDISKQLIISYQRNHLKTTSVLLRRAMTPTPTPTSVTIFLEHVITTAPTVSSASTPTAVLHKINNRISYNRKDIILLALICYMKLDEDDINKKNIFIAATEEDDAPQIPTAANEPERSFSYDEKYKYLYT
jgi:hypothetical protein